MLGRGWAWDPNIFPNLTPQNNIKKSDRHRRYNCIAWAAGSKKNWWWPDRNAIARKDAYWPPGVPVEVNIDAFILAFKTKRYEECGMDPTFEPGFEKIAIYEALDPDDNRIKPSHAARQLSDGSWTSKIGPNVDIQHMTPNAVGGGLYGTIVLYMKRPIGIFHRRSRRC